MPGIGNTLTHDLIGLDAPRQDPYSRSSLTNGGLITSKDLKTYQFVEELKSRSKRYRRKYYDMMWPQYYRAFIGAQWPSGSTSGWRSRIVVNYMYKIIERMASMMTDQRPKLYLMPPTEAQAKYSDTLRAALDYVWFLQDMDLKLVDFLKSGMIYGTGWIKAYWDPKLSEGKGDIQLDVANPFEIWIDPNSTGVKDSHYIIWERAMSVQEAIRRYPHLADKINLVSALSYSESKDHKFMGYQFPDYAGDFPLKSPVQYDQVNRDVPWLEPPPDIGGVGEEVTLTECWLRDFTTEKDERTGTLTKKFHKTTRLIQMIGPMELYNDSTPYEFEGFPYVQWKDISLPQEPYGIPTSAQLWSIQKELNRRRSQLVDHATYASNPAWIVDDTAMRDTSQLTTMPGLIVKKMSGTDVHREPAVPIPPSMFQMVEMAVKDLMEISGFEASGKQQSQARSGLAMEAIQEASTGIIRLKVRALEASLRNLGSLMIKLVQQFYTETRIIRIMSDPSKVDFKEFHGGWIHGDWDIKVGAGSTLPVSKMARAAQAKELFQAGALDIQGLLDAYDWPDKEAILQRLSERSKAQEKHEMEMALLKRQLKESGKGKRGTSQMKGKRPPAGFNVDQTTGMPL